MRLLEAENHALILKKQFPEETRPIHLLALIAFQRGSLRLASERARECLARGDNRAEVHKLLALTEYLLQSYDQFEVHIRTAIELSPNDGEGHYHLGRYLYEKKRYSEALSSFERVIGIDPDYHKARYYTGLLYEGMGQAERAKEEFLAAVKIVERKRIRYAWPFTDLGKRLVNEGDFERGTGWLYRAMRNDPASPHARFEYAKALFTRGATREVKESLEEAVRLDPGYGEAYYLLARYYVKTGEKQLAVHTLKKFEGLKKNPVPSPYGIRRW
ncbi:MAG: tetratricopeptide repeat protein [Pyrinomonadaceae bacterium]|nr:tetratricopeptide repeat protein [Pyrinomonadaceae bacterium]